LFEAAVRGLLPECRQCGGPTVLFLSIALPPSTARPALKFASATH
jgi:hypothetical protein